MDGVRSIQRLAAAPAFLLLLVMAGCSGEAETREDQEGSAVPGAARGTSGAEAAPAPAPAPAPVPVIPAGTRLTFEVTETVSTSSHSSGDVIRLRLVEPVSGQHGARISSGASADAVVTESAQSAGPDDEAVLALRVRSVQVNGRSLALNGSVESANIESSTRDSGARTAAKVATGAAVGAVIGQILGRDTRSTVTGAAAGTVAGLGIALTTRDGHATLPAGSTIVVRLDEPVRVQ